MTSAPAVTQAAPGTSAVPAELASGNRRASRSLLAKPEVRGMHGARRALAIARVELLKLVGEPPDPAAPHQHDDLVHGLLLADRVAGGEIVDDGDGDAAVLPKQRLQRVFERALWNTR